MNDDAREFVVHYLAEHGPSSVSDMVDTAAGLFFGADVLRQTLGRLETAGEVERAGSAPARDLRGCQVGGPRSVIWALPVDVPADVQYPEAGE